MKSTVSSWVNPQHMAGTSTTPTLRLQSCLSPSWQDSSAWMLDADNSLLTASWKESSSLPAITNLSGGDGSTKYRPSTPSPRVPDSNPGLWAVVPKSRLVPAVNLYLLCGPLPAPDSGLVETFLGWARSIFPSGPLQRCITLAHHCQAHTSQGPTASPEALLPHKLWDIAVQNRFHPSPPKTE